MANTDSLFVHEYKQNMMHDEVGDVYFDIIWRWGVQISDDNNTIQ